MTITLYKPGRPPQTVPADGLGLDDFMKGYLSANGMVARLLRSAPKQLDILASGSGYIVFSVFDHEGDINPAAMQAVATLAGVTFDINDEDEVLRGPVLLIQQQ